MSKTKKKFLLTGDAGSGKSILVFKMVLIFINYLLKENYNRILLEEKSILHYLYVLGLLILLTVVHCIIFPIL